MATTISDLQEDILWEIFTLISQCRESNSSYFEDRMTMHPIVTTCRMSRVCLKWRNIIMSSPSIWGGMLDIFAMQTIGDQGRKEIMKRTQKAKLSIYGRVEGSMQDMQTFFTALITENWTRIKELNVCIVDANYFDRRLWTTFSQTTAELVHLEVLFDEGWHDFLGTSISQTIMEGIQFCDYAPSLSTFKCKNLAFSPQAHWISQLRSFTLGYSIPFPLLTDMISRMRHLQKLDLSGTILHDFPSNGLALKRVHLPDLHQLSLTNTAAACTTILEHIELGNEFFSQIDISVKDLAISPTTIEKFTFALRPYMQRMFASRLLDTINLSISSEYFFFFGRPTSTISIESIDPLPPVTHVLLVDSISRCNLKSVKTFSLQSALGWYDENGEYIISRPSSETEYGRSIMQSLFPALSSVTCASFCEESIGLIVDVNSQHNSVPFPFLHEISVFTKSDLYIDDPPPYVLEPLMEFFSRRQEGGYPPLVFNAQTFLKYDIHLEFLENIKDLWVVWGSGGIQYEYLCGSGVPETLHFPYGCALAMQ